jgi:hypothetical protein
VLIKQSIISLFFLFVYTIGFSHGVIPHGHESSNHSHEHYEHDSENELESHHHVSHNDHFDESIYDLVLCLLSDLEHQDHECSIEYNTKINYRGSINKNTFEIVAISNYNRFNILQFVVQSIENNFKVNVPISWCIVTSQSRRGPPLS